MSSASQKRSPAAKKRSPAAKKRSPAAKKRSPAAGARRKGGDGVSTRQALLRAAAAVFARQGFRAATVDDVAAEAGLSKGAVYWHFKSKEDLMLVLLEEQVDSFLETAIEQGRGTGPDERLAPQASGGLSELLEQRRESLLLLNEFWSLAARDPKLRRHFLRRQRRLRDALTALLAGRHEQLGVPLTIPVDRLATAVLGLGIGLAMINITDSDAAPPELFGEILSLIYDGNAARVGD